MFKKEKQLLKKGKGRAYEKKLLGDIYVQCIQIGKRSE